MLKKIYLICFLLLTLIISPVSAIWFNASSSTIVDGGNFFGVSDGNLTVYNNLGGYDKSINFFWGSNKTVGSIPKIDAVRVLISTPSPNYVDTVACYDFDEPSGVNNKTPTTRGNLSSGWVTMYVNTTSPNTGNWYNVHHIVCSFHSDVWGGLYEVEFGSYENPNNNQEPPVCDFTAYPGHSTVPHTETITDASTGSITGYGWFIKSPSGSWDNTSTQRNTSFVADEYGYWDVYHEVGGPGGTDQCNYVIYAGSMNVTPTQTIAINRTVVTYQTIPSVPNGTLSVINLTDYKSTISGTVIGNFTAPLFEFTDGLGDAVEDFLLSIINLLILPLTYINGASSVTIGVVGGYILSYSSMANFVLVAVSLVLTSIPPVVTGLVTVSLGLGFVYLLIAGSYGNG